MHVNYVLREGDSSVIMSDKQHGTTGFSEFFQIPQNGLSAVRVKVSGGLVSQQDLWLI